MKMKATMVSTTNVEFKYFEGQNHTLVIEERVYFGNLYTSKIKDITFNGDEITINTNNSTYVFEVTDVQ